MVAATNQEEKLGVLCACAISLLQRGTRCKHQTQPVFDALAKFIDERPTKIENSETQYPGRFGNRCNGCGGFIDDGGTCNCMTDHLTNTPDPHAPRITTNLSHEAQVTAMIAQTGKAIVMVNQKSGQEMANLLETLQAYKEGESTRKQPNRPKILDVVS